MTTTETPATALKPEVVDLPADTLPDGGNANVPAVLEAQAHANALIERAADEALMPGVPGRDEFLTLAMTARMLCMSGAAPKEVRNNPYLAFHMAMVGRDLGISPSASLELIDVIPGRDGPRLSLSPQLLNGQVERLGLGHIVPGPREASRAIAIAVGPGGHVDYRCRNSWPDHVDGCECRGIIGDSEFTWEDARMAGIVGPTCEPGQHTVDCIAWKNGKSCNSGYKTYPKRMMWWRAAGFCADDWFPTASMGLYSPEALGAVVDEDGRPIDPASVTLPDGYEPEKPAPPDMVAEADRDDLRRRLRALPEAAIPVAQAAWRDGLDGSFAGGDTRYLAPLGAEGEPPTLLLRQLGKARALVEHFEQRARGGEWGDWTPPEAPAPATPPQGGGSGDDSAKTPTDDAGPSDAPPAGDGAGDPPPPPVTEPLPGPPADPTPAGTTEVCPVCRDSGAVDGEACWACTPHEVCAYCGGNFPRRAAADGRVRCIDEDACWEREQAKDPELAASVAQAALDVESREVTAPPNDTANRHIPECPECGAPPGQAHDPTCSVDAPTAERADDPDNQPTACPLCHSSRSVLVFVPHGHGQEGGMWRCSNAGACKERSKGKSGLDVARAALEQHQPTLQG